MQNPWLQIPYDDYERHMSEPHVGQLSLLSEITGYLLATYKPRHFAILGCGGGNGLEHVDNTVTTSVHAVDINAGYLEITARRYKQRIHGLRLYCLDISHDKLDLHNVDLFLLALILEYVDPEIVISKVCRCMNRRGVVSVVIEKKNGEPFVSQTGYTSLTVLEEVAREIDGSTLETLMNRHHLIPAEHVIYSLPGLKNLELWNFTFEGSGRKKDDSG
jgi:SAM-dependent methyltransferase